MSEPLPLAHLPATVSLACLPLPTGGRRWHVLGPAGLILHSGPGGAAESEAGCREWLEARGYSARGKRPPESLEFDRAADPALAGDTFGSRLRALLDARGMSIAALTRATGTTNSQIHYLLRDDRNPSLWMAQRICAALGCSLAVFDGLAEKAESSEESVDSS